MKILLIHKDFEPLKGGGGTARHIHGLATALVGLGCDVRVLAPKPEAVDAPYEIIPLLNYKSMHQNIVWADVVHVHGARSGMALKAALLAKLLGKPFLYTPHCWYGPRSPVNAFIKLLWDQTGERWLLKNAFTTIILTQYWRNFLSSRRMPSAKTTIIPNCVLKSDLRRGLAKNSEAMRSYDPKKTISILSVGRLSPEKRGRDLIHALAKPNLSSSTIDFVGKGSDKLDLEGLARDLQVSSRIKFHGFVSDENLASMIASSDVFVLASEEEGLPTIILEMIYSKIPVICTRIPGNLAITDIAGLSSTYEVGDVEALVELIYKYHENFISDEMVEAVERNFLWEERSKEIFALYKNSINSMSNI